MTTRADLRKPSGARERSSNELGRDFDRGGSRRRGRELFTTVLIGEVAGRKEETTTVYTTGTVKLFSDIKGYGFIASDAYDRDIFVHYSSILGDGWRTLAADQRVRFAVVETDRGPQAVDERPTASEGS